MDKQTYWLNGHEYQFNNKAFDILVRRSSKDGTVALMRRISEEIAVSVPSLKEWRRGAHSPSDIAKVSDLAKFFGLETTQLLKEIPMSDSTNCKLNKLQTKAFCKIYRLILNFNTIAVNTDCFVWDEYNLRRFASTLIKNVIPSYLNSGGNEYKYTYGRHGITAEDLHQQLYENLALTLDKEKPLLEPSGAYDDLGNYLYEYVYRYANNENDEWIPDPDMLYDPQPEGYIAPMRQNALEGQKALDELIRKYIG